MHIKKNHIKSFLYHFNKIGIFKNTTLNSLNYYAIKSKIKVFEEKQIESFQNERKSSENLAVNKIKNDKKYFFKYVNKFRAQPSSATILIDNNTIITDPTNIANSLQDHFKSVFSNPNSNLEADQITNFEVPQISFPLCSFEVTPEEIIRAIDQIKPFSSCPKFNIPAIVFKKCKFTICKPLQLFLQKSFSSGIVPSSYKFNQITPIHKKGSKTKSSNYRPIAITPHEIKIFERVIRKKLVFFFESNKLFHHSQHGFRDNRSCLTQLLLHSQNIINNLLSNNSVDTFYVDYAKAFDKVDYSILLKKLQHYGVTKEYVSWIKSFLNGRKQAVYINSSFSYEANVVSGIPQGSVLAPLLFIIFFK